MGTAGQQAAVGAVEFLAHGIFNLESGFRWNKLPREVGNHDILRELMPRSKA